MIGNAYVMDELYSLLTSTNHGQSLLNIVSRDQECALAVCFFRVQELWVRGDKKIIDRVLEALAPTLCEVISEILQLHIDERHTQRRFILSCSWASLDPILEKIPLLAHSEFHGENDTVIDILPIDDSMHDVFNVLEIRGKGAMEALLALIVEGRRRLGDAIRQGAESQQERLLGRAKSCWLYQGAKLSKSCPYLVGEFYLRVPGVTVRLAKKDFDMARLCELERKAWASACDSICPTQAEISSRFVRYPQGQFVLCFEDLVIAALFLASLVEKDKFCVDSPVEKGNDFILYEAISDPVWARMTPGDRLVKFVIAMLRAEGVSEVWALSRCSNFKAFHKANPQVGIAQYICMHVDSTLAWHINRGAKVKRILENARPRDLENGGCGVLLCYDADSLDVTKTQSPVEIHAPLEIVKSIASEVLKKTVDVDAPLFDLGFDSLALTEFWERLKLYIPDAPVHNSLFLYGARNLKQVSLSLMKQATPNRPNVPAKTITGSIEIIGCSAEMGQAKGLDCIWNIFDEGIDAIMPQHNERSKNMGAFLAESSLTSFDNSFWRVSPREMRFSDPQQRLLLNHAWWALEQEQIVANDICTGIFLGLWSSDFRVSWSSQSFVNEPHLSTGTALGVAAGRVAYALGCDGPALVVDTACSSGLVALTIAQQQLLAGYCKQAFAGSSNLILTEDLSQYFQASGMLSPSGRCKTFDKSADGYVRSEGCCVLLLKVSKVATGDHLIGAAINQDGARAGLTVPSGAAQEKVLQSALQEINDHPIALECHGTGTRLGDPIEVHAAAKVYKNCVLSAAKTNFGHVEAVSGLLGVVKVLASCKRKRLSRVLHFHLLNPEIGETILSKIRATIPLEMISLPPASFTMSVSSFGFSGTNCHVVLKSYHSPLATYFRDGVTFKCGIDGVEGMELAKVKLLNELTVRGSMHYVAPMQRFSKVFAMAFAVNSHEVKRTLKLLTSTTSSAIEVGQIGCVLPGSGWKISSYQLRTLRHHFHLDESCKIVSKMGIARLMMNVLQLLESWKVKLDIICGWGVGESVAQLWQQGFRDVNSVHIIAGSSDLPMLPPFIDLWIELGRTSFGRKHRMNWIHSLGSGRGQKEEILRENLALHGIIVGESVAQQSFVPFSFVSKDIIGLSSVVTKQVHINGLACRFADAWTPSELWKIFDEGRDMISSVKSSRWNARTLEDPRFGCFFEGIALFDAAFFSKSPREAICMSPPHRMVLECSWESIESCGLSPKSLHEQYIPVIVGGGKAEWSARLVESGMIDRHSEVGTQASTVAGSVSHFLGLSGPSYVVDTACSSAAVTMIHVKELLLRNTSCSWGLAGAVSELTHPSISKSFVLAGMLSPDGRCKTFDRLANGYVRGEGCGILFLGTQNMRCDHVCSLMGSHINHNANPNATLTAPDQSAQTLLMKAAYTGCIASISDIIGIEVHGTGTSLGDPVECHAIEAVHGRRKKPLVLSGAKANIGHPESGAAAAGTIRIVCSFLNARFPKQIHFSSLNEKIGGPCMSNMRGVIPIEAISIQGFDNTYIGLNSFGFSGTNAHILLNLKRKYPASTEKKVIIQGRSLDEIWKTLSAFSSVCKMRPFESVHLMRKDEMIHAGRFFTECSGSTLKDLWRELTSKGEGKEPKCVDFYSQGPLHQFNRKEYWIDLKDSQALTKVASFADFYNTDDHRVYGYKVVPAAFHLSFVAQVLLKDFSWGNELEFIAVQVDEPIFCDFVDSCSYVFSPKEDCMLFEAFSNERKVSFGEVKQNLTMLKPETQQHQGIVTSRPVFSKSLRNICTLGPDWGLSFSWLTRGQVEPSKRGEIHFRKPEDLNPKLILPVELLDSCMQAILLCFESFDAFYAPCVFEKVNVSCTKLEQLSTGTVEVHFQKSSIHEIQAHISVLDQERTVLLDVEKVCLRYSTQQSFTRLLEVEHPSYFLISWKKEAKSSQNVKNRVFLVDNADQLKIDPEHNGMAVITAKSAVWETVKLLQAALASKWQRLCLVTVMANAVDELEAKRVNPQMTALWSLGRCAVLENQDRQISLIDCEFHWNESLSEMLEITGNESSKEVSLRSFGRFCAAKRSVSQYIPDTFRLDIGENHEISKMKFKTLALDSDFAGEHHLVVRIHSSGLNFRDVLIALNLYPGKDHLHLGVEFSGMVASKGSHWSEGCEIFGLSMSTFSSHVAVHEQLCTEKPAFVSHEEAASLPVVFCTALACTETLKLNHRSILVHSVSGGVGQAAAQLSRHMRFNYVFGSASSTRKKRIGLMQGCSRVFGSRDTDYCEEVLNSTGGVGVSCVLNSLTGGSFIFRSVCCLAERGSFFEISKRSIWSEEEFKNTRPDASYYVFDLLDYMVFKPERIKQWISKIEDLLRRQEIRPFVSVIFPIQQAQKAFQLMLEARHVGKLVFSHPVPFALRVPLDHTILISGGFGGLGQVMGKHVLRWWPKIYLGRSNSFVPGMKSVCAMELFGLVHMENEDISESIACLGHHAGHGIGCVLHLAGVVHDTMFRNMNKENLATTSKPKLCGAQNLLRAVGSIVQISFSSVTSFFGNIGQSNYAFANGFLDGLAHRTSNMHSINWGPWSGAGMWERARERGVRSFGTFKELSSDNATSIFFEVMAKGEKQVCVVQEAETQEQALQSTTNDISEIDVVELVQVELRETLGVEKNAPIDNEAPFSEMGLDSMLGTELRQRLSGKLGIAIPATATYDYPSVTKLVEYIRTKVISKPEARSDVELKHGKQDGSASMQHVFLSGFSCRFSKCWTMNQLLNALDFDNITSSEKSRWHLGEVTRWGGFFDRPGAFDFEYFGFSRQKALFTDIQQRMALECSHESFQLALMDVTSLVEKNISVVVGVAASDYKSALANHVQQYQSDAAIGNALSAVAGQISYFFGLAGESFAIDTACSSSLVGLALAKKNVETLSCEGALVVGVNALLDPVNFKAFEVSGMLSPTGRCKTLDIRADGYVRGEGCGSLLLSRQNSGLRVIHTSVNQDGRTNGLTAPSAKAQSRVINQATSDVLEEVQSHELHGTGTSLGDPIEIEGIHESLLGKNRSMPLVFGAAKTSFGHCETSSGMLGVLRVVLCLENCRSSKMLHFQTLNNNIGESVLATFKAVVPTEEISFRSITRSSVSSFGFTGTNAFAVVEKQEVSSKNLHAGLLFVGHRTEAGLQRQLLHLRSFFITQGRIALEGVASAFSETKMRFKLEIGMDDLKKYFNDNISDHDPVFTYSFERSVIWPFSDVSQWAEVWKEKNGVVVNQGKRDIWWNVLEKDVRRVCMSCIEAIQNRKEKEITVYTVMGKRVFESDILSTCQAALWGLATTLQHEAGSSLSLIDIDNLDMLGVCSSFDEHRCAIREGKVFSVSLEEKDQPYSAQVKLFAKQILITGGSGDIGQLFCQWAANRDIRHIVSTSRGGIVSHVAELNRNHLWSIREDSCVFGDQKGAVALTGEFDAIVHLAGLSEGKLLKNITKGFVNSIVSPKVKTLIHLDRLGCLRKVSWGILMSSVTAWIPFQGQSVYGAANAALESFSAKYETLKTIHLGPVQNTTMTQLISRFSTGIDMIRQSDVVDLVEQAVISCHNNCVGLFGKTATVLKDPSARRMVPLDEAIDQVTKEVLNLQDSCMIDWDKEASKLGFDSATSVLFAQRLSEETGLNVPATILYEKVTLRRVKDHFAEEARQHLPSPSSILQEFSPDLFIVGRSCKVCSATDIPSFTKVLRSCVDFYSSNTVGYMDLTGEIFDHELFRISFREAALMNVKQQRALTCAMECVGDSGIDLDTIPNATNVYVGIQPQASGVDIAEDQFHSLTGQALSTCSGRISFFMNLSGESLSVDTACSSSLVIVSLAQRSSSKASICIGVNSVDTVSTRLLHAGSALSETGRCKTFDSSADGYSRGEACGALFLRRDMTSDVSIVRCETNQDGLSSSLTAPNGSAQQALMTRTFAGAQILLHEVHGTGTKLGDPIEMSSTSKCIARNDTPIILGASKTNFGHTETAAGIVGLLRLCCHVSSRVLHFQQLNSLIGSDLMESMNSVIPLEEIELNVPDASIISICAFSISGTNAASILKNNQQQKVVDSFAFVCSTFKWKQKALSIAIENSSSIVCIWKKNSFRLVGKRSFEEIKSTTALVPLKFIFVKPERRRETYKMEWTEVSEFKGESFQVSGRQLLVTKLLGKDYMIASVWNDMEPLKVCMKILREKKSKVPLIVVVRNAVKVSDFDTPNYQQAAALGFIRAVQVERPDKKISIIDVDSADGTIIDHVDMIAIRSGRIYKSFVKKDYDIVEKSSYCPKSLVIGGFGGLGRLCCDYVVSCGSDVVAMGRNGAKMSYKESLALSMREFTVLRSDVSKKGDFKGSLSCCGQFEAVWHLAGVAGSSWAQNYKWKDAKAMLRTKVETLAHKQIWSILSSKKIVAFCSEAGWFPGYGQSLYVAGSCALEAFARAHNNVLALCLGNVSTGMFSASPKKLQEALEKRAGVFSIKDAKKLISFSLHFLKRGCIGFFPKLPDDISCVTKVDGLRKRSVVDIAKVVLQVQGDIDENAKLSDIGFDSVLGVELAEMLEIEYKRKISRSIMFEHQTLADIERALNEGESVPLTYRVADPPNTNVEVTGCACRFGSYWSASEVFSSLLRREDSIGSASGRLGETFYAGLCEGMSYFDAPFFNISSREANLMDPQQRVALECSLEALEISGRDWKSVKGLPIGIYIGAQSCEYAECVSELSPFLATGLSCSVIAGRIAYILGTLGESMVIDTACSSSLVSIALGFSAVKSCLAGGVNALYSAKVFKVQTLAGMLSIDGRCKTFDNTANGYVRSEGCGVVFLETSNDEVERVSLLSAGANQDGASNGLTAPSSTAQESLLRQVSAGRTVNAFEAHGTGTRLGDPVEMAAITRSLQNKTVTLIGSVKPNFGHAESASGVLGFIKMVESLLCGKIPPQILFTDLNQFIGIGPMEQSSCVITLEEVALSHEIFVSGISSFGFSGTNAHVIIQKRARASHQTRRRNFHFEQPCIFQRTKFPLQMIKVSRAERVFRGEWRRQDNVSVSGWPLGLALILPWWTLRVIVLVLVIVMRMDRKKPIFEGLPFAKKKDLSDASKEKRLPKAINVNVLAAVRSVLSIDKTETIMEDVPLEKLGLGSIGMMELCHRLSISPSVLVEYDTIERLQAYMSKHKQEAHQATVQGYCDPMFQEVVKVFREQVERYGGGGQLCVKLMGKQVINVWAGDKIESSSTLLCTFSAAKGVLALCVAKLVDLGLVSYEDHVCKFWAEFSEHEKSGITVAQLMRHCAGLATFSELDTFDLKKILEDVGRGSDDLDDWISFLARQKPSNLGRTEYHAVTLGFYVSILVRKVTQMSVRQFFKLNFPGLSFFFGLDDDSKQVLVDRRLPLFGKSLERHAFSPIACGESLFDCRFIESPATLAWSCAEAMAEIYDEAFFGGKLLQLETLEKLCSVDHTATTDAVTGIQTNFSRGGLETILPGSESAFGFQGIGGNVGFADRKNHVSVSHLSFSDVMINQDARLEVIVKTLNKVISDVSNSAKMSKSMSMKGDGVLSLKHSISWSKSVMCKEQPKVCIVGAGLSGICMAVNFVKNGFTNFVIYERNVDIGGTWLENKYPGLEIDTPISSYCFSFPPHKVWSSEYPKRSEVLEYLHEVCDYYSLWKFLSTECSVVECQCADDSWKVKTERFGEEIFDCVVIAGATSQSEPVMPELSGKFHGNVMHSARWDESFEVAGKRIAIIGTGASGAQVIPAIAPLAKHVYVLQRTPSWVLPKKSWSESVSMNVPQKVLRNASLALADVYWAFGIPGGGSLRSEEHSRQWVQARVRNKEHLKDMLPTYPLSCRRVVLSNEYYDAMERVNVTLLSKGVEEVSGSTLILEDGSAIEVDAIVCCTGFTSKRLQTVHGLWGSPYHSYLGIMSAGLPNLFMILGPGTGLLHSSQTPILECESEYIVKCISKMRNKLISVKLQRQIEYLQECARASSKLHIGSGCHHHGKSLEVGTFWPFTTFRYWLATRHVKEDDFYHAESCSDLPSVATELSSARFEQVLRMIDTVEFFDTRETVNLSKEDISSFFNGKNHYSLYMVAWNVNRLRSSWKEQYGVNWVSQCDQQEPWWQVTSISKICEVYELFKAKPLLIFQKHLDTFFGPTGFSYSGVWSPEQLGHAVDILCTNDQVLRTKWAEKTSLSRKYI